MNILVVDFGVWKFSEAAPIFRRAKLGTEVNTNMILHYMS